MLVLLLALCGLFAYLAYDAYSLRAPSDSIPYAGRAKEFGQDLSHLSMAEQKKLSDYSDRYGLGNVNQSIFLFGILALVCGIGAILELAK